MRNSHDSVTQGHCDMIGQIILNACNPPPAQLKKKILGKWALVDNRKEREKLVNINIRWAKESQLLTHYSDVMKMDRKKIADAIIRNNPI